MRKTNLLLFVFICMMLMVSQVASARNTIKQVSDIIDITSKTDISFRAERIRSNKAISNLTSEETNDICRIIGTLDVYDEPDDAEPLFFSIIGIGVKYEYNSQKGFEIYKDDNVVVIEKFLRLDEFIDKLEEAGLDVWKTRGSIPEHGMPQITQVDNKNSKTYEINVLNQNGIIVGDPDGSLHESDGITRDEFAAVLCRAMGCETEAQAADIKQKCYFPDVTLDHWAAGYVNFAYENKAISGFPDGNFYPEQPVTNEQVIKMLIAAWGYTDEAEANGGYPNGYMKVAKEHGILDTIEFNYANASKRWVASIFVYGVLSMEPENEKIKQPVKTQLFTVDTPREENDTYVERPEEVLKNVSKESSIYERTLFEQTIPTKHLPIKIDGKTVINVWYRDFSIGINLVNAAKEGFNRELAVGESVDLSGFGNGEYNIIVGYNDGKVDDYSFGKILILDNGIELSGLMHRYTSMRDVIQFEKEITEVELSNKKFFDVMPFEIKVTSDGNENYILCINYSGSLKDDEIFLYSINDMDLKFDAYEKFDAPMDKIEPIVIQGLQEEKEYILQIRLDSEYLEKSIKGTLTVNNDDFDLKGSYQVVNMK